MERSAYFPSFGDHHQLSLISVFFLQVQYQHLNFIHSLSSENDPTRRPTSAELLLVLDSLVSSRAIVVEEGALVSRKPDGERRLLLNIELSEVRRVLSDIGGQRWKNLLMSD